MFLFILPGPQPASLSRTFVGAGLTLDTATVWGGIGVTGALSNIDVSGTGALTLGSGGIDASAAGEAVSISNDIVAQWQSDNGHRDPASRPPEPFREPAP